MALFPCNIAKSSELNFDAIVFGVASTSATIPANSGKYAILITSVVGADTSINGTNCTIGSKLTEVTQSSTRSCSYVIEITDTSQAATITFGSNTFYSLIGIA